jgi:phosphoribosylaminoimidazolecarboxamide formyltransferase/IMP cyclohydrolase
MEKRELFGIPLEQPRNAQLIDFDMLRETVTAASDIPPEAQRDLLIAYITLKYTQSNSVCFAHGGQTTGVGAGQQSRIHCTAIAAAKAKLWHLRQHLHVLDWQFKPRTGRPARDTAIAHVLDEMLPATDNAMHELFAKPPCIPSAQEKAQWLKNLHGVSLGSDGYIPFRDNIDVARKSGMQYVIQPGGSLRDADVIAACDEYGMAMVFTNLRLFHHGLGDTRRGTTRGANRGMDKILCIATGHALR